MAGLSAGSPAAVVGRAWVSVAVSMLGSLAARVQLAAASHRAQGTATIRSLGAGAAPIGLSEAPIPCPRAPGCRVFGMTATAASQIEVHLRTPDWALQTALAVP